MDFVVEKKHRTKTCSPLYWNETHSFIVHIRLSQFILNVSKACSSCPNSYKPHQLKKIILCTNFLSRGSFFRITWRC